MARIYKALCKDLKKFQGEDYDEQDDVKAFADFSGIYKFLRIVLAVILSGFIWYCFNL